MTETGIGLDIGVEPLGRRIVVQFQDVEDTVSKLGVHIPATQQSKALNSYKGDVVARGVDVNRVEDGDLVLISLGAGAKFMHNQEEYIIIDEMDVLAFLERV